MPELTWLENPKTLRQYATIQALNTMPWWMPPQWAIALAERRAKVVCDRLSR
ncbi:hypothetical protein AVDCRST_MAG94-4290 [uncultured Leptolyngbya sp.]|uniref:Uncharacterized protein n=1 Tax=uncultured Leptolyngbya sp. TaxID=332963 RepID=A0A6J4MYN4_9CYAN|nr:hypothetical protein AVDCRST_MAG94-4290 [uncultured Leptolyngbya sp.]